MSTSEAVVTAAATAGDQSAFSELAERYRRELQLHCYRMLGSYDESEDLVQETYLRAWRKRASFEGRSTFRAWLYRIATNACLDFLDRRPRRPSSDGEVLWLQPYPDRLLEGLAAPEAEPDAAVVSKETIELAFLVAIQHLPPRQRAVLLVRDVLGWSAKDTAALLETSVASVTSALQRARGTLKQRLPERRLEWSPAGELSREERALVERYVDASERADLDALFELMREDAVFSMPPDPGVFVWREKIVACWKEGGFGNEDNRDFRCLITRANMQPAVACYRRRRGDSDHHALGIDVLRIEDGAVAEIIAFHATVFPAFDLPPKL
jgi:RNA polymerase sigma-70 factor, ECF subfamily